MQKKDAQSLGEILDEVLQQNNLDIGLSQARASQAWKQVMGEAVNSCTLGIGFNKGTLSVKLSSSVLRNELFMNRRAIIEKLNESIGKPIISNIYFK